LSAPETTPKTASEASNGIPKANEVKALSPADRFVIAWHSPEEVVETGLRVCLPEKKATRLAYGFRRDTFSGAL